jgi:hypothetical protein
VGVNELSCILCELSGIPEQLSLSQKVVSGSEESRQKVRAECQKVSFGIQSWMAAEPLNRLMFTFINIYARLAISRYTIFDTLPNAPQGLGLAGAALVQPLAAMVKVQAREEHFTRHGLQEVCEGIDR